MNWTKTKSDDELFIIADAGKLHPAEITVVDLGNWEGGSLFNVNPDDPKGSGVLEPV